MALAVLAVLLVSCLDTALKVVGDSLGSGFTETDTPVNRICCRQREMVANTRGSSSATKFCTGNL